MSATIEEVAKLSGVSTATVSRALRGLPNVAPSTRATVIQTAETLNYAISPQASRIASGRSMIGIIRPLVDQWFYAKLAFNAEIVLSTAGYDVVRYSIERTQIQAQFLRQLINRRLVDGLIFSTVVLDTDALSIVQDARLPVVTIETMTEVFPSIGIDNYAAGQLATRHLINLRHRRIGLITGAENDPTGFTVTNDRTRGYRIALKEAGIEWRPEYEAQVPGNYYYEGGEEAMKQLFSLHQPPTAIFAVTDEMAIGALKAVRDMNLRVPQDISIIGFDDNEVAEYIGLTTIRQPVADYGEVAAKQVIRQFGNDSREESQHIQLPVELILRTTTGPHQN
ncbi:MAG: LacI family DNA-binding transcriptional regulator [Chloroflexota bacterium]